MQTLRTFLCWKTTGTAGKRRNAVRVRYVDSSSGRQRKSGARAHGGGMASVHIAKERAGADRREMQVRCRKAAQGTWVAETGRTPAGAGAQPTLPYPKASRGGFTIPCRNLPRAAPTMGTGACGPASKAGAGWTREGSPHQTSRHGRARAEHGAGATLEVAR